MPKHGFIKKTLVIGSGPIIIGQAAEFDYSGTQACRALKEEGVEVVLVNSNPATIMTDKAMADRIFIEPLTTRVLTRIIESERPDSVLPNMGGQLALNLAMNLHELGVFEKYGVKMLGAKAETIEKAEDRECFKTTMTKINQPLIPSLVVNTVEDALKFASEISYPVIVRPGYTLGGSGGGIAKTPEELTDICTNGLRLSRVHQALIEKCVSGWKEIEFEVMRDRFGNCIIICGMENIDPVGIHTGDSIVVAPCQTLSDKEYKMLSQAAKDIVTELDIEGGCNVQFAQNPDSYEYAIIEVNPRVSRSSALASKATGYPIAKVATKVALGYTLDELTNAVTGNTSAFFEPRVDYCVIKYPRFPFDKFVYANRTMGTQMKATGEIMAIGINLEMALMKAVRGIERGMDTFRIAAFRDYPDRELMRSIRKMDDDRLFLVYEALSRGISMNEIFEETKLDRFFLSKLLNLIDIEKALQSGNVTQETITKAKHAGFTNTAIKRLSGVSYTATSVYKTVDTCAAEFPARTPYYYSTRDEDTEYPVFGEKERVLVIGSGPIRIGQGIEFDYCTVHSVFAIRECGYEAIIANNNPETVSTDFDTADRLYFDPLTPDDIDAVIAAEKPYGVILQFGGQTAIKLVKHLRNTGVRILGTQPDMIDAAEDRERFDRVLEACNIPRPRGGTVFTAVDAVDIARELGYPVLLRPSYVLGGQNMIIAYSQDQIIEYMDIITRAGIENPVLIDKYIMGMEVEVDAICDGENILIPGIMEHIDRAGIHSGDSISVYPPQKMSDAEKETVINYTVRLSKALKVCGMVNIQYVIQNGQVYVIEVNPRSSRTVPYISKVTGLPVIDLATKCMLGYKLNDLGYGTGIYPDSEYVAVKAPVFSFEKLHNVDVHLGPEMKSTGEVLGIAKTFEEAMLKALIGSGYKIERGGTAMVSVRDIDKPEVLPIVKDLVSLGFSIYATGGTKDYLETNGIEATRVDKIGKGEFDTLKLIESGVNYIINTSSGDRTPDKDSVKMRRKAVERSIPCLTSLDTARGLVDSIKSGLSLDTLELIDITKI